MKIRIDENNDGNRIDSFLAEMFPNVSRSKLQAQIKKGICFINGNAVKPSYKLKAEDSIEFDPVFLNASLDLMPENIAIDVVWEDENMAVINKPSGLLTHPTINEMSGTLVNALLNKYGRAGLSDINGELRPGIVHRLDRNTSGLIMIAKNNKTHEFLVEEMKNKRFCKKYLAIVKGILDKDEFAIDLPLGRHLTQPHKQAVRDDGKESLTLVKVLERLNGATLVELTLITGRTHQIRVHMASIGHPVYNDTLYGFGKMKINTEEQVLQAYKLEFIRPFTQERILLEIEPDSKITKVLNALK